jgi:KUP system potassium uptake protein
MDPETRISMTGYLYILGGPLSWQSKLQKVVTKSTVEAEYYSLVAEMQEGLWLTSLINEIGFKLPLAIRLMEDNQVCVAVAQNPGNHSRTNHIDIRNHFIREKIAEKTLILGYCPTDKMIADIFTKALPRIQFATFFLQNDRNRN